MPELPEVETVRRDLEHRAVGRTITACTVSPAAPRLVQLMRASEFCRQLAGRTIAGVRRRGKYLIVGLDDGRSWVVHRRMSGNILWRAADDPPDPYTHAVFTLDDGHELRWTDVRKFGTMWLVDDPASVMETLGPEPLDPAFTPEVLRARARGRRAPIKSVVLDQTVIAGMGNLYTDEALHYARIHPLRPAHRLTAADFVHLHEGIVRALNMGIAARGSSLGTTLRDHINVDGNPGQNQETVRAYGREGLPCYECGTPMLRVRVGGRSSVFCPACQPAPRARRGARPAARLTAGGRRSTLQGAGRPSPRSRERP